MECNRDEALRAKEIAERKFSTKDIAGAKKFALKAQTLFPGLEGISQMVATLDIYAAAENKINGESDFYGILGVSPLADDKTVRGHYRNLALSLHPDKNKSIGADGAFKYISEAWSLLSDKARRKAYDQKRNTNNHTQNQNGFYNFTSRKETTPKTNLKTFWTVCHGCKMQYEYLRMYLHQNLLCPNCHEPFLAMETPAPNTKVSTKGFKSCKIPAATTTTKNQARYNRKGELVGDASHHQWGGPFSKTTAATTPSSSAQAATMVQRAYERVKREREEAQAASKREEALKRKRKRSSGLVVDVKKGGGGGVLLSNDIRCLLVHKARTEIKKRSSQWKSETVVVNYKPDQKQAEEEEEEALVNEFSSNNTMTPLMISVPDPDFHNFDQERSQGYFRQGEIWAAYDDDDGMPRNYAYIHKVKSTHPFKIKVCWLNSRTNNNEMDAFCLKAFGEFRLGKHENLSAINCFSHKVNNFKKLENGSFEVYPRKGEVWALYRHWAPEWNEEMLLLLVNNELKHKYEIVQVDECNEEEGGFRVTQLVKVAGFKTVFHRQISFKEQRVIPETEIFRFSHQIPSYFLTGQESLNAPKGCCELDPAATPDEFLQVIAVEEEVEEEEDNIDDESAVLAGVKEVVNVDDD